MPAHLRPVDRPKCYCGKPATVRLFNTFNAPLGTYCAAHGRVALKAMQARESGGEP